MYGVPGSGVFSSNGSSQIVPPMPLEQPRNLYRFGEQTIRSAQILAGAAAVANNTFRLFATPQGQNGQGFVPMSIAETNLKEGGRVPSGVAYDVFGIACAITAGIVNTVTPIDNDATISDLLNIQTNGVLTWDFTQTQVDIAPIILVGAGGGAFGALASTLTPGVAAANSVGHMNNGAGSVWMYRKYPVALPGNSTFSILLRFGAQAPPISATAATVKIILLGYYKNIVELG